jgi:hypothetical protein
MAITATTTTATTITMIRVMLLMDLKYPARSRANPIDVRVFGKGLLQVMSVRGSSTLPSNPRNSPCENGIGAPGCRRQAKQLGVLAWWSRFSRITAEVALNSDIPVKEYGPDGPEGMPLRGAPDDRLDLTCVPATQNPSSPMMVCTTTMVVVTAATDGGSLSPPRERAMRGANHQKRDHPQEDEEHTYA